MIRPLIAALLLFCLPIPAFAEDTLARVRREGVLRWGADSEGGAPYIFPNPHDPEQLVGFEVEIMERIARRMGVRLQGEFGDWNSLPAALEAGRIDVLLNGYEILPEREAKLFLTVPYFLFRQQLTIRTPDRDRYRDLNDLKGKPVAVLGGSASVRVLQNAGWDADDIKLYSDSLSPYGELKVGRVEAVLADNIIAFYYAGRDSELLNLPDTFAPGRYAGAVRKEDRELARELNRHLKEMMDNGELGQIYQKWGMWSPVQEELGIARGERVEVSELAQHDPQKREGIGWSIWRQLIKASGKTVLLTAWSMPLALVMGLGLALMGRSTNPLLRWPARTYIQVIRGTPLLVQVFLIYYTLPELGKALGLGTLLTFNSFVVGVICLAANYAAYEAEIHRAGIDAVPPGQRLAALALGMSERQAFVSVVLPQSFRIILPPVLNDLIAMLKDSCVVYVIGVQELLTVALGIGKARVAVPELLVMAAVLYLILSLAAEWLGKWLERRLRQRGFNVVGGPAAHH
jgi:polar amino acid transport system substrate-binding protein